METHKNTKGVYIKKTYFCASTDKPPKTHIKNWVATVFKDISNANPITHQWVKWIHNITGKTHCVTCLSLHDCWFNCESMPKLPQHYNCHCTVEEIPYTKVLAVAKAESDYSKFDPYLFNRGNKYTHNKEKLFEKWGYTIDDAKWLQTEIERQGKEKYIAEDYTLGKLDLWGQRINIRVEIERKDTGNIVSFDTGWMLKPNGIIILNTPYGGK